MLDDLKLDTVEYLPTYDEARTEPSVLPSKFPNLLVNGATGIAVGMATSIPPHNLREICDALIRSDRRTGSLDRSAIGDCPGTRLPNRRNHLRTWRRFVAATTRAAARLSLRARARIEEMPKERTRIIVTEIPYQQYRDRVVEKIAALVSHGRIKGISGIRDESDLKEPVRSGHRHQTGRRSGRRSEPAVSVLAAAGFVLADLPGSGGWQAARAEYQGAAGGVHPASRHGHSSAHSVPAQQGTTPQAHRGRSVVGVGQH